MQRRPDKARPPAPETRASHHCRSILIACGDPRTGGALASGLAGLGCFVAGPFTTGRAALDWVGDLNLADMALLDVELADGLSLALARALQKEGMPLVFFAGFDARRRILRAEDPGRPGEYRDYRYDDLLDLCLAPASGA